MSLPRKQNRRKIKFIGGKKQTRQIGIDTATLNFLFPMKPVFAWVLLVLMLSIGYWVGQAFPVTSTISTSSLIPPTMPTGESEEVKSLKRQLASAQRKITALEEVLAQTPTGTPANSNASKSGDDLAGLVRDAAPLINRLTPMFEQALKRGVDQQVDRLTERLGLSKVQSEQLRARLTAISETEMAKLREGVTNPEAAVAGDAWRRGRNPFSGEVMETALKDILSPEQFTDYQQQQAAARAENITRSAEWQISMLDRSLKLSETQKDQIFEVIARNADPTMQVQTGSEPAQLPEGLSQEEGIRSLLTPEQQETYDADQARRREGAARWRGMFRGGR